MGTPTHRLQEDPAEGSRETINRELERRRESGARNPGQKKQAANTPAHRLQEDPAEGSRETIDHELERQENRRESGARKLDDRRDKLAEDTSDDRNKATSGHVKQSSPSEKGGDQARKAQKWGGGSKAAKGPISKADRRNENSSQKS